WVLVEAPVSSQFNHIGGGTKTWRPITLHMKYHPDHESPLYSLVSDSNLALANHMLSKGTVRR
ncbi:hypothetical protein TorRG33x02_305800, partial [Trema orientale]